MEDGGAYRDPAATAAWDDGVYSAIRRLKFNEREWVCSIQIEYDQNGESIWSPIHGTHQCGSDSEVVLNYPAEFLTSIYGTYGSLNDTGVEVTVIRSITVVSNRETYGPFGVEDGTRFSLPISGSKIVGFHGKSASYLNSIGVHVQTTQKIELQPEHLSLGQYGGEGGYPWKESFQTIRRFMIYHGLWIDAIQFEYVDHNQDSIWSRKQGGDGGYLSEIVFEYDEQLLSIHGYYGSLQKWGISETVIRSLTLKTNKRTYGPFGIEDGTKFAFPFTGLNVIGIHGRSDTYLDAIGLSVHATQRNVKGDEKFSLGEYGGEGGDPWEEEFGSIKELIINHGEWIDSIQLAREDEDGELVWSEKHGGDGGSESQVVLDFPDEHIVTIHGYYENISDWGLDTTVIRSLTLETNKNTYGPFGVEDGTKFSFPIIGVKIVGIHGRSGLYLDAIGLDAVSIQ